MVRGLQIMVVVAILTACQKNPLVELTPLSDLITVHLISAEIQHYCPGPGFVSSDFIAINESYLIKGHKILIDYDQDGVADQDEKTSGQNLSYKNADSDFDGYSDLVVNALGLTREEQLRLPECANPGVDNDGDGLNNCEERLLGTNGEAWDTDGDGIPDRVELRVGLSPMDAVDVLQSASGDGISNFKKIHQSLALLDFVDTADLRAAVQSTRFLEKGEDTCFTFTLSSLPVVQTGKANRLMLYFIDNQASGVKRLRTVQALLRPKFVEGEVLKFRYEELAN